MKKIVLTSFCLVVFGVFLSVNNISACEIDPSGLANQVCNNVEEVVETQFVQADILITSLDKETLNLVTESKIVPLEFTTTNATKCWYDLGGNEIFLLKNCANTFLNLGYDKDYVLNIHASNGTETDPSQYALDSVWFKTPKQPAENNENQGSSSGSIPQRITTLAETGRVLGAEKFIFTLPLKFGSRGDEVTELQKRLIQDGFLKITAPTGYFGPLTFKAVKEFQLANGLVADGIVGPLTRQALNK